MYVGSVKFFKHVIYSVLVVLFVLALVLVLHMIRYFVFAEGKSVTVVVPEKITANVAASTAPLPDVTQHTAADLRKPFQLLYPSMYSNKAAKAYAKDNTVYLTFDDGPSPQTLKILDILRNNNIKATFFVVGKSDTNAGKIMKQIVDEGHAVGVHSYTHDYEKIYRSVDAFLNDFYKLYDLIYNATGVKPNIFRFAGGSINSYNKNVYKDIIEEMTRRGFTYYDWNVSSTDTKSNATVTSIRNNVLNGVANNSRSIVLFHDSKAKDKTVAALDGIIKTLKKRGFGFDLITNEVKPIVFNY